ncbi:hypothetical protein V4C85_00760 [Ralstonia solanacearum]|uniref:hypothetical protein n=1 Tax=Ralstonia solanacearum TaxID=305 RepID=UPI002304D894|nr:hypothetical protein [Ralstonia solanacearum]MDB0513002.1 hypothetical protein [Ralstonia solanacearum]
MRDVTDNVTGELAGLEQRRGRGRPRKAHAMSNAERQAAYRARRQAERVADRSVTITKKLVDVDAYDECRVEVERLREQLDELRREKEIALRVMREQRDKAEELGRELFQLKRRVLQEKSVTPSNGNPVSFDVMLDLISLAAKANTFEQRRKVRDTVLWFDTFVRARLVSEAQMRAAGEAIYGERKVVTRKE